MFAIFSASPANGLSPGENRLLVGSPEDAQGPVLGGLLDPARVGIPLSGRGGRGGDRLLRQLGPTGLPSKPFA